MRPLVERYRWPAALALLAGVAALAGSFLLAGETRAFVGAPVAAFVVTTTPASVVAFSIQTLGLLGDVLGFLLALVLAVLLLALAALAGLLLGDRTPRPGVGPLAAAVLVWVVSSALTGAYVLALGAAVPAGVVVALGVFRRGATTTVTAPGRRRVVALVAGVFGFAGVAYAVGNRVPPGTGGPGTPRQRAAVAALQSQATTKALDAEGIPGLVSPIDEFYEVDVNSIDPVVEADSWQLTVTGEVDHPQTLTYADLTAMPAQTKYKTLRCVGERLNSVLLDNAIWTGVPIKDLLAAAGPRGDCGCVVVRAADDYYEEFPLAALRTGFLAYGMNGESLPRSHGAPVRLLVPGHWGEITVKWVTEVEVLDREATGFWEERGWHGTGPVNTVAKLWAQNHLPDGAVQVAGHAYAGTRGIQEVQVSTDGGQSWNRADLSEPLAETDTLGGLDAWRQWQYTWTPSPGSHEVVVRAVDGEGNLQPRDEQEAFPSGASGWVTREVRV